MNPRLICIASIFLLILIGIAYIVTINPYVRTATTEAKYEWKNLENNPKVTAYYAEFIGKSKIAIHEATDSLSKLCIIVNYTTGSSLLKHGDYRKAIRWFYRAAELGHAPSQKLIGEMLLEGKGGHKDPTLALMWFMLATENGDAVARSEMHDMLGQAGPEQILKARKLCARWKKEHENQTASIVKEE